MESPSDADIGGEFRLDTLLCRLLRADDRPHEGSWDVPLEMLSLSIRQFSETLRLEQLPDAMSEQVDAKLLHERAHYWQLLFYPLVQSNTTVLLERLQHGVDQAGGDSRICATNPISGLAPPGKLESQIVLTQHNFGRSADAYQDLETAADFDTATHLALGTSARGLPGFVVTLKFEDSTTFRFPLTAPFLLESAAVLVEALQRGRAPERLASANDAENCAYLGAWEFWCRVNQSLYPSITDAAEAFLAFVDLSCRSTGVIAPGGPDLKPTDVLRSVLVSARAGEICLRSAQKRLKPMHAFESPSAWQAYLIPGVGLPDDDDNLLRLAYYYTRLLLPTVMHRVQFTPQTQEAVQNFLQLRRGRYRLEELEPMWNIFWAGDTSFLWTGQSCIGVLLAATVYRLRNPDHPILPHRHYQALKERFPLPVVHSRGRYYAETEVANWRRGDPYPYGTGHLMSDIIGITALAPLAEGRMECGFVTAHVPCSYMERGLGCPQMGLTAAEKALRDQHALDDWCHWMFRLLPMGLPSEADVRRWQRVIPGLRSQPMPQPPGF